MHLHVYVKDVDRLIARAEAAGGKVIRPVSDQFYGDRSGTIEDPFGHLWHFATHKEDLSMAEPASAQPRRRREGKRRQCLPASPVSGSTRFASCASDACQPR